MTKTAFGVLVLALGAGCGSSDENPFGDGEGGGAGGGSAVGGGISFGGNGVGGANAGGTFTLPADFTQADRGGWKLGEPASGMPPTMGTGGCSNTLTGIVRDFQAQPSGHPDFELPLADNEFGVQEGIVQAELGADRKPVYAPSGATTQTTGTAAFDQWYRTETGINQAFYLTLFLVPANGGTFTFESKSFFPLDGSGFGNSGEGCSDGTAHNFHFTFELHTQFRYSGGETFTFIGDDDVFVFINGQLALDLGGVHGEETRSIDLDDRAGSLGIMPGMTYPLDMFHAERHFCASNFRVDTTLEFTNCGEFVPDVPR